MRLKWENACMEKNNSTNPRWAPLQQTCPRLRRWKLFWMWFDDRTVKLVVAETVSVRKRHNDGGNEPWLTPCDDLIEDPLGRFLFVGIQVHGLSAHYVIIFMHGSFNHYFTISWTLQKEMACVWLWLLPTRSSRLYLYTCVSLLSWEVGFSL